MGKTVSIDEALKAIGIVELLRKEIALIEIEAKKHWIKADEYCKQDEKAKSTFERELGNVLMERAIALKQIME